MFKKEEFQALMEREGVMDFIFPRSTEDIPNTEINLFHLANNRWGCIFKIIPPVFCGEETEKKLGTFFKTNLPNKSSIQIFSFASRNLHKYQHVYMATHSNPSNVERQDLLKKLANEKIEWMRTHANQSVYQKGIDLRLRNYVNFCCITIPRENENGILIQKSEVINIFTRVFSALSDFVPAKCTQQDYVKVVREILVPDMPLWNPPEDKMNYLNYQVVDNDSTLVLEEETNTIGIGKMISKEAYDKKQKKDISVSNEEIKNDKKSFFSLFSMKKKEKEKREAYTNWHAKVYSTKQFPPHTSIGGMLEKFYDLLGTKIEPEVPCPYFSSLTVYIEDKEKTKREVFEKTQWNLWQTSSLGQAVRFFPEIRDRAHESEAINELINQGDIPMTAMWSVVIMDDSLNRVSQYGERLRKSFMSNNWIIQEESLIPHLVLLYSLPLQFDPDTAKGFLKRLNTLFSSNCAAISPLMTGSKSLGNPVLLYVDRAGQLVGADPFTGSDTNYNFIVVGDSGSGKSYTMNDFFAQYLMTGAKIRVIDIGRSYKNLCELVGGQYIEFTEAAGIRLNFFTNIKLNGDGEIHEDEMQTVVPLIAMMAMQSVHPDDATNIDTAVFASHISRAVRMAYDSKGRNAGIQDVSIALENILREDRLETGEGNRALKDLITALYSFSDPRGEYYKYFNGPANVDFLNDFVVIELEELEKKDLLKSVVLASLSHKISTEFFLSDLEQIKILAVDEAWSLMDNKVVMRFLETMGRRIRKYNGGLGIITQRIGDFNKNSATKAIFDSSATKMFLQQNKESLTAQQKSNELNFDEGMIYLLSGLRARNPYYSEILIKQNSSFFIGRLITDKFAHWIYANNPKSDRPEIERIMRELNVSEIDARIIKGFSAKNSISVEESFIKLSANGELIH